MGWARQPLLDCNLEQAAFYPALLRPLQRLRIKRWDYYAVFTPQRFFSATIADLGYAGNIFVYTLDFAHARAARRGAGGAARARCACRAISTAGETVFEGKQAQLRFDAAAGRRAACAWIGPPSTAARASTPTCTLACPPEHESMNIVIPIRGRRFYYNRKINCLPAAGTAAVRRH